MIFQLSKNADCPCNSGKKYKMCCLGELSKEHEQYYGLLHKEGIIKNKLLGWAKSYFSDDELDDYVYEFNQKHFIDLDMGKEITPFFDWLFLEAIHKEEGKRILDIIIDYHSHVFEPAELEILEEWRDNTQSGIYEVIETNPEDWTIKIKEIFTEKEYNVIDRKASSYVVKGDILFGRLQKVFSYYYLSGVAQIYPRLHVFEQLKQFINNHLENAKKNNPKITYEEFMNKNSKILNDFSPEEIKIVSSDNEEVEISEAIYSVDVKNINNILDYFDENQDKFIITDVDFKNNKFVSANVAYKGSDRKNQVDKENRGIIQRMNIHLINENGERMLVHGSIDIQKNKLKINSFSKKSFEEIKDLLNQNLKGYVHYIKEDIITAAQAIEELKNKESDDEEDIKPIAPEFKELGKKFLENYYKDWCDMKIPMLGNKTPREAIKTEEGKKLVNDLLLDFENTELHKKREGLDHVPVEKIIRKELNFYENA